MVNFMLCEFALTKTNEKTKISVAREVVSSEVEPSCGHESSRVLYASSVDPGGQVRGHRQVRVGSLLSALQKSDFSFYFLGAN